MKLTFPLQIVSLKGVVFEDHVESVYLSGSEGEFEILPFHRSLLAGLPEGEIKIAHHDSVPIKVGIVMFKDNKCIIVVEADPKIPMKSRWDDV